MKISRFIYKNQFAKALGIHKNTFKNDLKRLEPKLKEIFPEYSRHSQLLPPKLGNWLIEHYGIHLDELYKDKYFTK